MLQGVAIQKLHGDESLAVLLANVVNSADIGMVQGGSSLRFPLKPAQRLGISRDFIGQEFQGNKSVKPGVLGLVDHTHPTTAELLYNPIVRDGLADHRRRS